MKRNVLGGFVILMLVFLVLYSKGTFGVSANNIEEDARISHHISSTWEVTKSVGENIAALLFYDESHKDYMYSIYIKRDGLSFGYFFIAGGSDTVIPEDSVRKFRCGSKGSVLMSMNTDKVSRIELDNGNKITRFDIDPKKPFSVVIPSNPGAVKLYNIENELVTVTDTDILK